jgi:hypothetical protein
VPLVVQLVIADPARGQSATARIRPILAGDCEVVVELDPPRAGDHFGISIDLQLFPEQRVAETSRQLVFAAPALRLDSAVRLIRNGETIQDVRVGALPANTSPRGRCASGSADEDPQVSFDISAYLGTVVDTFAPDSIGNYRNPYGESQQKMRDIFGVSFDIRLWGRDDSPRQFWLYGETLHGVRTADIDCTEDPAPVCSSADVTFAERARYIIKHATSLEGYINPRLEFATLQAGTTTPMRLYVTGRFGFISLEDAPSVFRTTWVGLGLIAEAASKFSGSYVEVGVGKNELFSEGRWNRLKVDGLLSFGLQRIPLVGEAMRGFVQMAIDNDLQAGGADSVQTLFGVDFEVGLLGDD